MVGFIHTILENSANVSLTSKVFAEELPFPSESFDSLSCLGALLYFADVDKALQEFHRVLKPRGNLMVRNLNRRNLYTRVWRKPLDPASSNIYSAEELSLLLERHGFTTLRQFAYGFFPPLFPKFWWYLQNGILPLRSQQFLSDLIPSSCRISETLLKNLMAINIYQMNQIIIQVKKLKMLKKRMKL